MEIPVIPALSGSGTIVSGYLAYQEISKYIGTAHGSYNQDVYAVSCSLLLGLTVVGIIGTGYAIYNSVKKPEI
jgi:hypothetical protein